MTNKLTFVNGAKAACGCCHEFSSGGGEYSDVAYVHLCALHAGGAPVLDDRWKARMLDGRALERDEMGLGDHPEIPQLDEGMKPRGFFAALGLELIHTMAEDQLDGDALEAMSEAVNWTDWTPTPPQGDGWKLVAIFDTEEGPAAWWLRELAEAEDGTTTIRNLQAEVEKLKARAARAEAAHAAKPVDTVRSFRDYLSVHEVSGRMNGRAMDDMALDLARIALDFKHLVNTQAEPGAPATPVDDMAALVKQLVQALRKAAPNHALPAKALDYLRRQGLLGSPLRSAAAIGPQPSAQET